MTEMPARSVALLRRASHTRILTFAVELTVPPNTTAEVVLPDGSAPVEVGSSRHTFTSTVAVPDPVEKPQSLWAPD